MSDNLNRARLTARVLRARKAVGRGCRYRLGKGGFDPRAILPFNANRECDCSGLAAWVIGTTRDQASVGKPWAKWLPWIETSYIVSDANGAQRVFTRIPAPVLGCLVVYGDRGSGNQGHVGIVTAVRSATNYDVVDCSSGSYKATGEAIRERRGDPIFEARKDRIFVVLKEDYTK